MNWAVIGPIIAVLALLLAWKLQKRRKEHQPSRIRQKIEKARRLGDQASIAKSLYRLGTLAHRQGQLDDARNLYRQSLDIVRKLNNQAAIASCLHELGRLAEDQGNFKEAVRLFQQALEIFKRLRSPFTEIVKRSLERAMRKQGKA